MPDGDKKTGSLDVPAPRGSEVVELKFSLSPRCRAGTVLIRNALWSLGFEDFPDCSVRELRMPMRFRVSNAFVEQPGVQLIQRLDAQPRREEAFADRPD